MYLRLAIIFLISWWWFPGVISAATINAASCTPAAVQAAVDSATPGDTVHLPTCTQNWATAVLVTTNNLILEGNGTANTILNRTTSGDLPMFVVSAVTGFEMRSLTLDGTFDSNPNTFVDIGVLLIDSVVDFRIHAMVIRDLAEGIRIEGDPTVQRGVIDHNTFTNIFYSDGSSSFGYAVVIFGNATAPALSLGTAQNIFIEDNTFTGCREAVDANDGARYVFRYNTGTDNGENAAQVATHGWDNTSPFTRGTRQYEIYHNTLSNTVDKYGGIAIFGGDGVIFNNVLDPGITEEIQLWHQTCASYPLQDQIRDLYLWNNTVSGGGSAPIYNHCTAHVQLNRDYFLSARPSYTPYTYPHPLVSGATAVPVLVRVIPAP